MRFLSDRHCLGICSSTFFLFCLFLTLCLLFVPCNSTGKKAADFYEQVPVIIRELLHRLNDDSTVVLKANHKALGALTSCVPAEELVTHIQFIRNLIASMVSDARYRKGGVGDGEFFLPGFNMPKGMCKEVVSQCTRQINAADMTTLYKKHLTLSLYEIVYTWRFRLVFRIQGFIVEISFMF